MKGLPVFILLLMTMCSKDICAQESVDTISYSIGMSQGARLLNQGAKDLDYDSFIKGLKAVLEEKEAMLDRNFSDSLNYVYFQNQRNNMSDNVKQEGLDFLEKNGKRPEVTTTASGLQYEVLVPAEGPKPTATTTVTVHYVGKLLNGKTFDSSVDRGESISFPLNRVIPGWTEGLQLMSAGSKYRLFIPEELAYGSRGAGRDIPPFSALIFDVELLSF